MTQRAFARRKRCVLTSTRVFLHDGGHLTSPASAASAVKGKAAAGYTLLELIIVCAIISIVAGLSLARFSGRDQAGRLATDVARRVRERRASAIRINNLTEPTVLENFRQPPVTIDFSNLSTTAPLVVEGATHTTFNAPQAIGGTGTWTYVYQGDALQMPAGWRIARSASELSPIPLMALGSPVTSISFTTDGRLSASSLPAATGNTNPNVESPFPAIYLTDGTTARAVAVHPSGLVEIWQYDEAARSWRGFGNRTAVAPGS
jgi:prepilin-type N-terminal cleavage/methylation domain-containing protein